MRDTIVIGASAGGIGPLSRLVEQLPRDLPAAVLVVMHMSPTPQFSALAQILGHRSKLRVSALTEGERFEVNRLYVARPDRHLALEDGVVVTPVGPRVNGHRPAIDVLFRTAAYTRGSRVIGVILSGMLDDGVGGLLDIRSRGGVAVVQTPDEAEYPDLPRHAIRDAGADHVVGVEEMGKLLVRLVVDGERGGGGGSSPTKGGPRGTNGEGGAMPGRKLGPSQDWSSSSESPEKAQPSVYSCPECGGVLGHTGPDDVPRFVCRTGHAYDSDTLLVEQATVSEQTTWSAIRALEEQASLARRLELRARAIGEDENARRLNDQSRSAEQRAGLIRSALARPPTT